MGEKGLLYILLLVRTDYVPNLSSKYYQNIGNSIKLKTELKVKIIILISWIMVVYC